VPAAKKIVGKTLLTTTILNVTAKLLATELIATTCSDFFFHWNKTLLQQLYTFANDFCRCKKPHIL
jgi:hypothetical protein